MTGRVFTATFENQALTAAADFFELIAPTEGQVTLLGWAIGQDTEEGSAEHEMLRLQVKRATGAYTSGSGGASATPQPVDQDLGTVATGCAVETCNTTQAAAGSGALNTLWADTFDAFAGTALILPPDYQFTAKGTDALILSLAAAPADSISFTGSLIFRI